MITAFLLFLFFIAVYAGTILYLWWSDNYEMLKKVSFMLLLFPTIFAGNFLNIGVTTATIGIFFVLFYYLIGFIMCCNYKGYEARKINR